MVKPLEQTYPPTASYVDQTPFTSSFVSLLMHYIFLLYTIKYIIFILRKVFSLKMCAWFVLSNQNQHSFFQPFLSSKNKVTRHTAWHNEKNITSEEVQIPFCTQNPLTRSVILLLHSFINMMLSAAEQVLQKMNHCKCSTG